jgi:diacylglycerol O-acyltransferase / wax synthase
MQVEARMIGIARRPFDPAARGWTKMEYRRGDVRDPDILRETLSHADVVVPHETGTTVGDVCTALVAGAVSSYLDEHGGLDGATGDDLASMVPVNLEPFDADLPEDLGNHFALVLAVLPHAPIAFRQRLAEVHTRMVRIRDSYEPMITFGISRGIAVAPAPFGAWISDSLAAKAVGVLTNVPGPRAPMSLAGAPVQGSA